ncbi:MAG: lysylphosphatidylglycerol synthase transmembrane domain-containing protein [Candidatus Paceibacterota bacterium]
MSTLSTTSKKLFSWSNIFFFALCCAVLYIIIRNLPQLRTVDQVFKQIDGWWITVAFASQAITYLATATLYYVLLNGFHEKTGIKIWRMFKMSIVIVFINQIVPSGGIGGNGFLYSELSKNGVTSKKTFFTIIMECLSLYIAMALLLLCLPLIYLVGHTSLPHLFLIVIIYGFIFYAVLATAITIFSKRDTLQYLIKKLSRFRFISHYFEGVTFSPQGTFTEYNVSGVWDMYRKYPKQMAMVIAGHLTVFLADGLTIFALMKGLELHASVIVILLGLLLSNIIAALPISPGSLLVFEGAMTFFYSALGIPFQAALVITLMYRVLSFWIPVIAGLLLYKSVQTKNPE